MEEPQLLKRDEVRFVSIPSLPSSLRIPRTRTRLALWVPVAQVAVALLAMAVEEVAGVGVAEAAAKAAARLESKRRSGTSIQAIAIKKESLATSDAPKSPAQNRLPRLLRPLRPPTTTAVPARLERVPRKVWRRTRSRSARPVDHMELRLRRSRRWSF